MGQQRARGVVSDGRRHRVGTVYLLHFARPYHHARHYLGFASNLAARIKSHRLGKGSPLIAAVIDDGIEIFVARTWENVTRAFERRGHRKGSKRDVCPICLGRPALKRYTPRRDPLTGVGT